MSDSSVVIRGIDARTFSEMESFVKDLEGRPIERLLKDLAELVKLPQTKVSLVSYVFYTRFRAAEPADKQHIRDSVASTYEQLEPGESRERVAQILDRLSTR
jgi:hypothetical protein